MGSSLEDIRKCVVEIDLDRVRDLTRMALNAGVPPYTIFTESLSKGMEVVGRKYENQEYFLTELLGAAEVVKRAMEELGPTLQAERGKARLGVVALGTVKGDIHDIGKNIVKMLLTVAGFDVHDLDVDVSPERFAEEARDSHVDIVALSSLLTTTLPHMQATMDALSRLGLRQGVKVIIGGASINEEFAREIGADAAARDAGHGVRICKEWVTTD